MVITNNESGASVASRITCLLVTVVVFGDDCEVNFDDKVIENSIHNSSLAWESKRLPNKVFCSNEKVAT